MEKTEVFSDFFAFFFFFFSSLANALVIQFTEFESSNGESELPANVRDDHISNYLKNRKVHRSVGYDDMYLRNWQMKLPNHI